MNDKFFQIRSLLQQGKSYAAIVAEVGCSMSTISKVKSTMVATSDLSQKDLSLGSGAWSSPREQPITTTPATTRDATLAECNEMYKIQTELQRCRIRRYLLRSLAGCKKATGMSASDLTLWLEMRL